MRVKAAVPDGDVTGFANSDAAASATVVILAVPFSAQAAILKTIRPALKSAILVDATVPLAATIGGKPTRLLGVWEGSAAQAARDLLPGTSVVSAFHNVSADILQDLILRETRSFSQRFARKLVGTVDPVMTLSKKPQRQAAFRVLRAPDGPSVLVHLAQRVADHQHAQRLHGRGIPRLVGHLAAGGREPVDVLDVGAADGAPLKVSAARQYRLRVSSIRRAALERRLPSHRWSYQSFSI